MYCLCYVKHYAFIDETAITEENPEDKPPEEMRTRELKRWLKSRGANRHGKKQELIDR